MRGLRETQELFFRCVRFDPAPTELERVFVGSDVLSARDCMAIYRNMYWYRLVDALFDVFPRVAAHLGRERFTRLACRYLAAEPSRSPELERAGHALARWLRETGDEVPERELVADLARLEYAGLEVLLSPNAESTASLAEIDPTRFPFQVLCLSPAVALVEVRAASLALFEGRAPDDVPPDAMQSVLFSRPRYAVRHRALAVDEAAALSAALAGVTVEQVCAALTTAERASAVLRRWFEDLLVARLSEPS